MGEANSSYINQCKGVLEPHIGELTEFRRELHQFPELKYEEIETAKRIRSRLSEISEIRVHQEPYGQTGVIADLVVGETAPWVCLRADIDALPIEECTGKAYASKIPGKMHACGHDGHTAILLGAAQVLSRMQDRLQRNVRFVFQPAEEGGAGAQRMIEDGAFNDIAVEHFFGLHGMPDMPLGSAGSTSGIILAAEDTLKVLLTGIGGHAGFPSKSDDLLLAASDFMQRCYSRVWRRVPPSEDFILSFTTLEGNGSRNVLPSRVELGATLRSLSPHARETVQNEVRALLEGLKAERGFGCELTITPGYPPVDNDRDLFLKLTDCFERSSCFSAVVDTGSFPVSEDFAYYSSVAPANFWLLGLRSSPEAPVVGLHEAEFDFNDDAIEQGVLMHCLAAGV